MTLSDWSRFEDGEKMEDHEMLHLLERLGVITVSEDGVLEPLDAKEYKALLQQLVSEIEWE